MTISKRSALMAGAFWIVPLLSLALLRTMLPRGNEGKSKRAPDDSPRVSDDGQVRSPSPASHVAALATLPYILQAKDSNSASGVVVHRKGAPSPGLNFFFPWSWRPPRALLMDLDGKIVWQWSLAPFVAGKPHQWLENAVLLPDGSVLFSLKEFGVVKVDRDSRLIWEARLHVHHDLWPGDDGHLYTMIHDREVVPGIHPTAPVEMDAVAILSADGRLEKRIRVFDLLRGSPYDYLIPRLQRAELGTYAGALDVFHMNHVEPLDGSLASRSPIYRKGNLLISVRNLNAIAIVDPVQEKILWLWGPGNLTYQHDPRMLANGEILVFDNGTTASEVVQVDPLSQQVTWRYAPGTAFFSALAGAVQRLPNGNTLITESMAGHAFEVNRKGETVWRYSNPEVTPKGLRNGIIRMTRVDPSTLTFLPAEPLMEQASER